MRDNLQYRKNSNSVILRNVLEKEREDIINDSPNFVLIDAALCEGEIDVSKGFRTNFRSLFRGKVGEELNNVAPLLFPIETESDFASWLEYQINRGAENRRVLWIRSPATLDELRKHLRRFLRVRDETGGFMFFRLYDPIVLKCVLPNLTKEQYFELFSEITYSKTSTDQMNQQRFYYYSKLKEDIMMYKKQL